MTNAARWLPESQKLAPEGTRRMGANPHANGGVLKRELQLPNYRDFAVEVPKPGGAIDEATRRMGKFLREVLKLNADNRNFRIMGPDETASNRLDAVFETTDRVWMEKIEPYDVHLSRDGRVMEVLSEHLCQGWLEGYLLTGRHGLFSCYEAFIHIVDSMFNQHAKWLKVSRSLPWRRPIASLNYLLTSHVWRQDHNGFSHQDPGFVDLVTNKKADIVRVYLPPDANTLLWITDHCLRTYDRINVIVAGKQPAPQWLTINEAAAHCDVGIGVWPWAGTEREGADVDVVMACAGDVPTLETLAAVDLLRQRIPDLKIRVVNVVDLMTLQPREEHPHGLSDRDFDAPVHTRQAGDLRLSRLSLSDSPPDLPAHQSCQHSCARFQGGRHHDDAIRHGGSQRARPLPSRDRGDQPRSRPRRQGCRREAALPRPVREHHDYVRAHGEDMPDIHDWSWPYGTAAETGGVNP